MLSDPFDEIRDLERFHLQRRMVRDSADQFSPDMIQNMALLGRGTPWMRPGVLTALSKAGFKPDDPLIEWIANESAYQRSEENGWVPVGETIRGSRPRPERARLREAISRAEDKGLVDSDGFLHEPTAENRDRTRHAWRRLSEAFTAAGMDMPYIAADGRRALQTPSSDEPEPFETWSEREAQANPNYDENDPQRALEDYGTYRETFTGRPTVRYLDSDQAEAHRFDPDEDSSGGGGLAGAIAGGVQATTGGRVAIGGAEATGVRQRPQQSGIMPAEGFDPSDPVGFLQPAAQGAFLGLNAPVQEAQGQFRNVYAALHGRPVDWLESQSDLGINVGRQMRGEDTLSGGEGWFVGPGSPLDRERYRREARRGQLHGQNITLGRAFADWMPDTLIDPDERSYRVLSGVVDAGVQVFADPADRALKGLGALRARRGLFQADEAVEAAGGISGLRRVVHGPTATAFLDGRQGSRILEDLAADPDPYSVWVKSNRNFDRPTAVAIADSDNPEAVREVLRPLLGTDIRSPRDLALNTSTWGRFSGALSESPVPAGVHTRRWLNQVPGRAIDTEDPQSAVREAESWMRNAQLPEDQVRYHMNEMFRASTPSGQLDVTEQMMRATSDALQRQGASRRAADRATTLFRDSHESNRLYNVDAEGNAIPTFGPVVGGEATEIGPHLSSELIQRYIPLPDYRRVRNLSSNRAWRFLTSNAEGEDRMGVTFLHWVQDDLWKPFQLARLAYPLRVIGEEQTRMGAAGYDAMFRNPLSYVSWAIGRTTPGSMAATSRSALVRTVRRPLSRARQGVEGAAEAALSLPGRLPGAGLTELPTGARGATDVLGTPFTEARQFQDAMAKVGAGRPRTGVVHSRTKSVFHKGRHETDQFVDGWASELHQLHTAPEAQHLARSDNIDDTLDWFVNGSGRGVRTNMIDAGADVADEAGARRYLETVAKRIDVKTGGNEELLDTIRTGRFRGTTMLGPDQLTTTAQFRRALGTDEMLDSAPDAVVGREALHARPTAGSQFLDWHRDVTDRMFASLMGNRTNTLSRSVVFRQAYYQRVEELIPFMDDAAKTNVITAAEQAGLGSRTVRRMRGARAGTGDELLDAESVDTIAKAHGLDSTRDLLYDLSERGQFFDSMKLVFPFGEAWKEMFTRWGTLIKENPSVPRRFQQIIQGARGPDFGEVMGAPEDEEGRQLGFFHKNEYGEEVFGVPGSQWLNRTVAGVPAVTNQRVGSLNFMSQVMPGIGPVAQFPVAYLLQNDPFLNEELKRDISELILPFGTPLDSGDLSEATHPMTYAPSWLKKFTSALTGGEMSNPQGFASAQNSVMEYLYSTGNYDISTAAGMQELAEDAEDKAKKLSMIDATFAFGAPAAPSMDFLVEAPDGLVRLVDVRDDYQRMREEDFETADQRFLDKYGSDLSLIMQARSQSVPYGLESTEEFARWAEDHPDLARDLPNTYGLFGPRTGEYAYLVQQAQIRAGDRVQLTPEQRLRAQNGRLGNMLLERARRIVGPNPDEAGSAFLRDFRASLRDEYPGFGDRAGFVERADTDTLIREMEDAADNPAVRDTPVGQGLALYMRARSIAASRGNTPTSFRSSQSMIGDRQFLRDFAAALGEQYEGFDDLFDQVLSRELSDEDAMILEGAA